MMGEIRSLNLSNSVAIAVYEVLRQWDFPSFSLEGKLTKFDWKLLRNSGDGFINDLINCCFACENDKVGDNSACLIYTDKNEKFFGFGMKEVSAEIVAINNYILNSNAKIKYLIKTKDKKITDFSFLAAKYLIDINYENSNAFVIVDDKNTCFLKNYLIMEDK